MAANHDVVTGLDRNACNFIVTTTNVHISEGRISYVLLLKDVQLVTLQETGSNATTS